MLFKVQLKRLFQSYSLRVASTAAVWLLLISMLHLVLNSEKDERKTIKIGYMPVITNLAAPILDFASTQGDCPIRFKAIKFASFAEMAEAFRNEKIQAAFIIAPLSIVLYQQGEDVRVVYIGNRHESTLVVRKDLRISQFKDLDGYTVAVPMRYSGHNLVLQKLIGSNALDRGIRVVEMNPPDMASALTSGSLDAYFVGEPFAAKTLKAKESNLLFYVENVQPNFICNLMIVKQKLIDQEPGAVKLLVEGAARSGIWAKNNIKEATKIASQYWGQPIELVEYALNTPPDRIVYSQFIPKKYEIQEMANAMMEFGLIQTSEINNLIQDQFALQSNISGVGQAVASVLKNEQ